MKHPEKITVCAYELRPVVWDKALAREVAQGIISVDDLNEIARRYNAHEGFVSLLIRAADSLDGYCEETNGDMNDSLAAEIRAELHRQVR